MVDDRVSAQDTKQPDQPETYDIGVLFVHGIGAQRRGETLGEFGASLYGWLTDRYRGLDLRWREAIDGESEEATLAQWRAQTEAWANDGFHQDELKEDWVQPGDLIPLARLAEEVGYDTVVGRVRLTHALMNNPEDSTAPAHAELLFQRQRIEGNLEAERWVLAESWWAETFTPPSFHELARWGLRTVPWAVGNHFGAQIRHRWAQRPQGTTQNGWCKQTARWFGWLWRALAGALWVSVGLLLSPLLLVALAALLLVALLPIPQVREALLKTQLRIASTLGDSYMLVSRPIEAAAIVTQVQRDISWLAERCKVVAVVAHSQGGAVARKVLQGGVPPKLKLLFTFGSGLKKLAQLEHILSSGRTHIYSAGITIIALLFFVLISAGALAMASRGQLDSPGQIVFMMFCALVPLAFLVAGIRDQLREIDLPDIRRWVQRLKREPLDWVDCFATTDPVSNGFLLEEPAVKEASKEVCNLSSILRDHTSYWKNRDQFVTLLVERLTQPKLRQEAGLPPAPELMTTPRDLEWIARRRRWRVGILTSIGWVGALSVLLAAWRTHEFWWNYLADLISAWATGLASGEPKPPSEFVFSWRAPGIFATAVVPWGVTGWRWRVWNEAEMRALVEGRIPAVNDYDFWVLTGLSVQLIIAAWLLYGEEFHFWVLPIAWVGPWFAIARTQPKPSVLGEHKRWRIGPSTYEVLSGVEYEALSGVEKLGKMMWGLAIVAICGFGLGWGAWSGFVWLGNRFLDDFIFGFQPSAVSSVTVGWVVALIVVFAFYGWLLRTPPWLKKNGG